MALLDAMARARREGGPAQTQLAERRRRISPTWRASRGAGGG